MISVDLIFEYFPSLTEKQKAQFTALGPLYAEWNEKINVISRKDMDLFYERHVLHSLGIAQMVDFKPGSKILDVGTGGGFPGIPLAILFPEVNFVLVDSIGKKIKVAKAVAEELELSNVTAYHERAEKIKGQFDFVVSRAVTHIDRFIPWVRERFSSNQKNAYPNGIFYLKGGDLTEEFKDVKRDTEFFALNHVFELPFFETKQVVYVNMM
jgi:16S rRNA (guanine527-N7)-methyltransferase